MKILFDFLTLHYKNGASEYTRRIFYALLERIETEILKDVWIYCLYDSKGLPSYEEFSPNKFHHNQVRFVDYQLGSAVINRLDFDIFFLACAHSGGSHPDISQYICRSIIVVHDCVWEEIYNNDIGIYLSLNGNDIFRYREHGPFGKKIYWSIKSPTIRFCRWLLHCREHGVLENGFVTLKPAMDLFNKRIDNELVTVSDYSKASLLYNFHIPEDRVNVRYSPERIYKKDMASDSKDISDGKLNHLIISGIKYYLIVNAGRENKNAIKALRAFRSYSSTRKDFYIVTVGFKDELFSNHIDLKFLNDGDLQEAYKNCYALLYPSVFEGFGYPPLEAMFFGKPILSSNVCSIPEVLGDAPIYFSPFYESAIFNALFKLDEHNYEHYSQMSSCQNKKVKERQQNDLDNLVAKILKL